ncbi:GNAT family N-acetyltransferase [Pseudanabaena sp. UWO310]|uniref:GNAT family N-acetyltransferase n=1 Tax=Pseudanabaena sp. UWO310 TaxID=2480795 RepID=UPI001156EC7B|nr:GNAT family N-acetyltransferase [Pseudanabaena sp. UWO310]TYQ30975.1 GNAT family N-acetyltransferase [Pseudanabaena sp. UWO310]
MEWKQEKFTVSDCRENLDFELIYHFLNSLSYWAKDIPREVVVKSLDNSLCFGLFQGNKQIGFGRVVTDYATFAYLADVFVVEEYRKKGLGKWLIECIIKHPQLQGLRRWMLATADAQGLYHQYGFVSLGNPERFMEKHDPNIYRRSQSQ